VKKNANAAKGPAADLEDDGASENGEGTTTGAKATKAKAAKAKAKPGKS